ncbi:MAG: helix-hairpin-helix domain-containing protein [Oscillospiraceae bacterium]|nr:helix-hairpin-helix domain-containing protein [Oscillospiraceae bacterium]
MKLRGKLTKTEWLLFLLAGVFLAVLGLAHVGKPAPEGADYTITAQRQDPEALPEEELPALEQPEAVGPVDINTAGLDELDALPGIGPVLAQRILDYREANGPFLSVEELMEVKGIGEKTLEKFRDSVTAGEAEPPAADDQDEEEAA